MAKSVRGKSSVARVESHITSKNCGAFTGLCSGGVTLNLADTYGLRLLDKVEIATGVRKG